MFAKITMELCNQAVEAELNEANRHNQPFHSLHEGWAVMREEQEEAFTALTEAAGFLNDLWDCIKTDCAPVEMIELIQRRATETMMEAAQLAAMARKMIDYCNEVLCE